MSRGAWAEVVGVEGPAAGAPEGMGGLAGLPQGCRRRARSGTIVKSISSRHSTGGGGSWHTPLACLGRPSRFLVASGESEAG